MYVPSSPGLQIKTLLHRSRTHSLPFPLNAQRVLFSYMTRNVIYQLFRALDLRPNDVVLMPDYNSGCEVWAVRTAGATVHYYPIRRNLEPDWDRLSELCETTQARVLYVIHYFGWPQAMVRFSALAKQYQLLLVEDCALALLSESQGQPLGSVADYSLFCFYKSVPVPHGGLLVQNRAELPKLNGLHLRECSSLSLLGRTLDLLIDPVRSRLNIVGYVLSSAKKAGGRLLSACGVERQPVGDINPEFSTAGFRPENLTLGMSTFCHRLLSSFDYEQIRLRRRANYRLLCDRLSGTVPPLHSALEPGVCPLLFPLLVSNKSEAVKALRSRGIEAVELWNYGLPEMEGQTFDDARYLRTHLIELPVHQDLDAGQIEYMASQVLALKLLEPTRWHEMDVACIPSRP